MYHGLEHLWRCGPVPRPVLSQIIRYSYLVIFHELQIPAIQNLSYFQKLNFFGIQYLVVFLWTIYIWYSAFEYFCRPNIFGIQYSIWFYYLWQQLSRGRGWAGDGDQWRGEYHMSRARSPVYPGEKTSIPLVTIQPRGQLWPSGEHQGQRTQGSVVMNY